MPYDTVCSFKVTSGYLIELYDLDEQPLGDPGDNIEKKLERDDSIYIKIMKVDGGTGAYELSLNSGGIEEYRRAQLVTVNGSHYFSDLYDDRKLYKDDIPLTSYPVRSICSNGDTVYFAAQDGIFQVDGNSVTKLAEDVRADFLAADSDNVYFSDWIRGGSLYALRLSDNMLLPVCKDVGTWLYLEGSYLYYYNVCDGGELYRIQKNKYYAENGEKN